MLLFLAAVVFPFFLDLEAEVKDTLFLASYKISDILRFNAPKFPPDCLLCINIEGEDGFLAE